LPIILAGAASLLAALPVHAQQPADTTRPIALEPVEVNILRTSMSEHMAPLAVASLGEAALRRARSGAFLEEALRGLPGVHVQNRYNFALGERVVVRGFGGRAQFGVRGVRLIVDGIPATLADGQGTLDHLDVGSLGRVEVVRGAASSLFGNASGGVLVFESRLPPPEAVRLEGEIVGGSHGLSRAQATGAGTVSGTGYLVNLSSQGWDGYRRNPVSGAQRSVYGVADRTTLNAQLRRAAGAGEVTFTLNHLNLDSENPGELLKSQIDSLTRTAHGAGAVNNVVRRAGKEITQTQAGLRWDGALGGLETDVGAFWVTRRTINPIVPTIIDLDRDAGGARLHLSRALATAWGPLRLHAGAEGEVMVDDRLNFANVNGERGPAPTVDQRERVRSAGLFFQGDVPLPGSAEGLVGLRYDRLHFRAQDHIERAGTDPSRTGERTMDRVSPSVGVNLPVGGAHNVFANWGTVFETPSTTELGNRPDGEGGFNPDLEPQTGTSVELGVRGRAGGVVSYELSGYRTELRNEIVRFQVPTLPGRDFFRNAGRSRHTGVEATLSAVAPSGLVDARVTYTYTNARFRTFVQDGVDVGGNRIPGLAPQRADAVVRFNPLDRLAGLLGPFGELVLTYVDAVPVNDRNTEGFSAPSYVLVDVRGGLHGVRMSRVTVSPWLAITNLLDEYYVASVVPNAAAATPAEARYYDPGPGRSLQLGLRASWGAPD
jgi:iron complex outermembrane receptor protein